MTAHWILRAAPGLLALLAGAFALLALLYIRRRELSVRRLAYIVGNESGGVQSVSFVLTVPLFIFFVMFMVQIGQIMIGMMVVHYAAFAASRAAQVWIPASVPGTFVGLGPNEFPQDIDVRQPILLDGNTIAASSDRKREKIWTAAVLACAPIAPSRASRTATTSSFPLTQHLAALQTFYPRFDPAAATNGAIPARLANKLTYSAANTRVYLTLQDRSSGPPQSSETYNPSSHPDIPYRPYEAGWQDPAMLVVQHDFRILPGPARRFAQYVVDRYGRYPIRPNGSVYQITLSASTTLTIEGLKSVRPVTEPDPLSGQGTAP
ncbi:TadE family protein [Planctomyces sp. SH-PL14]|uniref:TadE family protein n=1 Tax=Planctomyces sp. SH-PL14 TaxID=1632864 RepID=UPI00078DE6F4|nr:TadE family protein [Planctomyces sp. SH-PL14]AMV20012.1 hypothetical protein VT03_19090 [Planctomyces sp. SH-PL14]